VSAPTLLQIVPTLAGGGLARATLEAAQAVIAAGGSAIVASPGGSMVPDLLRLRASHLELPDRSHPLWGRMTLPGKLASNLREAKVDVVQARSHVASGSSGSPRCTGRSSRRMSPAASSRAASRAQTP
jgi:hypothetical protein